MLYRSLGKTGLMLSELGFGCASYWGKPIFNEKIAINLIAEALEGGITVFDTGHSYSQGHAEKRLGKALLQIGNNVEEQLCLSTKGGTRICKSGKLYNDFSATWIEQSFHQSLSRLKQERLGIYYLHGPNVEDLNDDLFSTLLQLKQQGLVQALGVNAFDESIIKHAAASGVFDCIMLDYNILAQNRERLIQELNTHEIAVVAAAPLAGSLYSRRIFKIKGLKDLWYLARAFKNSPKKIWAGRKYRFINDFEKCSGAQVALRFVLNNPHITCAIFGSTDIKHLRENLACHKAVISENIFKKIAHIGKKS